MITQPREFFVIIERDEDGMYIGEVPQLPACYSQERTLDARKLVAALEKAGFEPNSFLLANSDRT
jgi:predicted RNase H-like HicB family nuclease